ncbi:hypothetical protein RAA17_06880 [Komagataeibacter rhaeticus]|nr:hypothetical protein [Komagataeibacter rhaeticus]
MAAAAARGPAEGGIRAHGPQPAPRLLATRLAAYLARGRDGHCPGFPAFAARRGLETLHELLPELICLRSRQGMLADLSAHRRSSGEAELNCGTQVHGMAALLNGIALHGGLLAFGASTIIAVDRMRPALRYAAMTDQQVIYLLTDDNMLSGDNTGGWRPVEQLASLRAMPNMAVFRPADHRETMECLELALRRTTGPSLLTLESTPSCPPPRPSANCTG